MKRNLKINFSKTKDFSEIDFYFKTVIRKAVVATLENQRFPYDAELSVTLCDSEYIKRLNKKYRNIDKVTDVLSFPIYDNGDFDIGECIDGACLGDVVISLPRAKEQAGEIGNTFLQEIAFLTVHSVLHLLGYDHERSTEEDELQCSLQKTICETLDI